MIKVLNSSLTRLGVVRNAISANRMEQLNGENTLDFEAILDNKLNSFIDDKTVFELNNDYFDIALFKKTSNEDGTYTIGAESEHVSYRLNNEEYNKEYFTELGTPIYILSKILEGTGFSIGSMEYTTTITYSAQEPKSRRQLLMEFVALLGGEAIFNKFTISIVKHRGSTDARPVIKDCNIKVVSKIVNKRELDDQGKHKISYVCTPVYLPEDYYTLGDNVTLMQSSIGINENLRVVSISSNPYDGMDVTLQFANYVNGLESGLYKIATLSVVKDKLYNGCRIGPEFGFEAVRNDKMARAYFRSDGLVMQSGDGSGNNWKDRLYYTYDSEKDESVLVYDGTFSTEALNAVKAYIGELDVDIARIAEAVIQQLDVTNLIAEAIEAQEANITNAVIVNLTAKNFVTEQIEANTAKIVELLAGDIYVDELRTSGANHIHIKEQMIKLYDSEDESKYGAKAEIGFTSMGGTNVPAIVFGVGDGSGGSRGVIYKDTNSMQVGYIRNSGGESSIDFGESIVVTDGTNKYVLDLAGGEEGWGLVRKNGGLKFGPTSGGGAISVGNANFIVSDHYLSEAEVASLANNTLVVVYDPSDFTAKYGTSPYEIAANAGYAGSEKNYNDALSQVGNLGGVLNAILGEG